VTLDGEPTCPEGIKFHYETPDGEVTSVKVLTDTGAGISCVSRKWVEEMKIPIIKGKRFSIKGITGGRILTDEYIIIQVTPPLRPEITVELTLIVLPGINAWTCQIPFLPKSLKKYKMYMADPDILGGKGKILNYPILVGGGYMVLFRMGPVYSNNKFALVDSIAGLIPRGNWPSDEKEIRGFQYKMPFDTFIGVNSGEKEIIEVKPFDNENGKEKGHKGLMTAHTMEDLELNYEIIESVRRDRIELQGALASEIKLSAKQKFEEYLKTIKIEGGRIVLPLPKSKGFPHKVRDNHWYGELRGRHLRSFLDKSPYSHIYHKQINDWIEQGKLVKTSLEELKSKNILYSELTHHAVQQPEKPSFPIRVVINGNSKNPNGYSPNDWLDQGVNLLPLIPSIIFNIRNKKYYFSADISKAFLQIKLDGDDAYRIIIRWPVKDENGKWHDEFYRFAYLPWGISCAPFCLAAGIKKAFREKAKQKPEYTKVLQELSDIQYADDLNSGGNTKEEVRLNFDVAHETAEEVSMPLGKYKFDPAILAEEYGVDPSYKPFRILGCGFDPETSCFYVPLTRLDEYAKKARITKRQAWGLVARFFDVLGIAAGCQLKLKLLRQEIDRKYPKAPWDLLLSKRETKKWMAVIEEFKALLNFKIPRVLMDDDEFMRIYMLFTDASRDALGAVLYSISFSMGGKPKPVFIMAKTKLLSLSEKEKILNQNQDKQSFNNTGKHPLAINKLELLAAVLGAKMTDMIRDQFKKGTMVYAWTDSMNVARWLRRGPITGAAILDRKIQAVFDFLPGVTWQYVPGEENPADLCSRPQTAAQLMASPIWHHGPAWMTDKAKWPKQPEELSSILEYSHHLKEEKRRQDEYNEQLRSIVPEQSGSKETHTQEPEREGRHVMTAKPQPPAKIRYYDEPLTDILFRDRMEWDKVVVAYAYYYGFLRPVTEA
jgi:hypothetical protein